MRSSIRVILNTGIQYFRTIISVGIALYSSRIILRELGESDYGIYNLVAGVIAMLSFISTSLSSTTQRYLSFHQGKRNVDMQIKIFNNSIFIQFIISFLLLTLLYFIAPFLFNGFLNIPPHRIETATIVYYCMLLSLFFSMLSSPYLAVLFAHENIFYSSVIQIIDSLIKLIIAISLIHILYDKLIYYAITIVGMNIINFLAYMIYCTKKYYECKHFMFKSFDLKIFKEMFSFSGWMLYSTACIVFRTQGIAVVLNKFFGTVINAAYGIAQQVSGHINFISTSMLNAIRPQIMKAEGEENRDKMLRLSEIASKFSFFLLAMIVIPSIFEMRTILAVWLGKFPEYTVVFSQYIIATSLVDQLTVGLIYANQAIGNIKYYSLIINTIKLLTLPIALLFLILGFSPVSVMICIISIEFVCSISRLFFLRRTGGLSIKNFIDKVFKYEIIPLISVILTCWICHLILPKYLFLLSFIASFIVLSITVYYFGLCEDEKSILKDLLSIFYKKIKKNNDSQ